MDGGPVRTNPVMDLSVIRCVRKRLPCSHPSHWGSSASIVSSSSLDPIAMLVSGTSASVRTLNTPPSNTRSFCWSCPRCHGATQIEVTESPLSLVLEKAANSNMTPTLSCSSPEPTVTL
jgi:hypothetical protein